MEIELRGGDLEVCSFKDPPVTCLSIGISCSPFRSLSCVTLTYFVYEDEKYGSFQVQHYLNGELVQCPELVQNRSGLSMVFICKNEYSLLNTFMKKVKKMQPDLLLFFNQEKSTHYLQWFCQKNQLQFDISKYKNCRQGTQGLLHCDIQSHCQELVKIQNYNLETVQSFLFQDCPVHPN